MISTTLRKIGNSVGVILPKKQLVDYNIGDTIEIEIVQVKVTTPGTKPAGNVITSEEKREEVITFNPIAGENVKNHTDITPQNPPGAPEIRDSSFISTDEHEHVTKSGKKLIRPHGRYTDSQWNYIKLKAGAV